MIASLICCACMECGEMLIREIITNRPLTPEQQQQANIKRQQKALKVKKAQMRLQAAQRKLAKVQRD